MRTTLTIDDDVLGLARALARQEGRTVGEVISALARRGVAHPQPSGHRSGIPLLASGPDATPITLELVNRLRDELA